MAVAGFAAGLVMVGLGNDIRAGLGTEVDATGALVPRIGAERAGMTLGPRLELTEDTMNAAGLDEAEARAEAKDVVEDIVEQSSVVLARRSEEWCP